MGLPESQKAGQVVSPGQEVLELGHDERGVLELGPGLHHVGRCVRATKPGKLRQAGTKDGRRSKLWLEGTQKRYWPQQGEPVVGIVAERLGEAFAVNIGAPGRATLNMLSFEGATRRNRPNLNPGDAVYARVEEAPADTEATLTCVGTSGKAEGYGQLKGGMVMEIGTGHARALLNHPRCPVLAELGEHLAYEVAVGRNGRVWVDASSTKETILVANAISEAEHLPPKQARSLVRRLALGRSNNS